jgi:hypothetical protein
MAAEGNQFTSSIHADLPEGHQQPAPTSAQRAEAEVQARRALGEQFPGVNLDLPGFKGLLRMEVDKILRTNAA